MKRYDDIQELLHECSGIYGHINGVYERAIFDEELKLTAKAKIKNFFENIRSCLDYIAFDLYLKFNESEKKEDSDFSIKKKVYFPYGRKKSDFLKLLMKYIPNINENYINIIESIQPYVCEDDWLIDLCEINNFSKHIGLEGVERENSLESLTSIGGAICIDNTSKIYMEGCSINGVEVSKNGPVCIDGSEPLVEINKKLNHPLRAKREFSYVKFVFKKNRRDALELMKKSSDEINRISREIYSL